MNRMNRYNRLGWVLCECIECKRLNYVEPHGTTAKCAKCKRWTNHVNVSYDDPRVRS